RSAPASARSSPATASRSPETIPAGNEAGPARLPADGALPGEPIGSGSARPEAAGADAPVVDDDLAAQALHGQRHVALAIDEWGQGPVAGGDGGGRGGAVVAGGGLVQPPHLLRRRRDAVGDGDDGPAADGEIGPGCRPHRVEHADVVG